MSKKKKLGELINDNKENAEKLSAADIKVASNKDKIEKKISKLIFDNKQNSKELSAAYKIIAKQEKEIKKQAEALIRADKEKEKRRTDLISAKKELAHKAELIFANKELAFQIEEKEKRAGELIIANKELAYQNELKEKRAIDLVITNKKLQQLIQLNKDKDKFFSIITHDLKNPFIGIIGLSEILIKQIKEKNYEKIGELANIILQSSNMAMDLLMNLMLWAQSQSGRMDFNPEYFDIITLVDEVTHLLNDIAEQKSILIASTLPPSIQVNADKEMISTVLRNLISNAIKFTQPEGKITISAVEKQNELTISVSDTGVGISKEGIDNLFKINEKYSTPGTQNEEGTGLGLILCKEFIEKHGGKVWVESEEGTGSVFYFTIPSVA